jgi:cyclic pyranopterin phosphate synthase
MKRKLSHVDKSGNPAMVDVSGKEITRRTARAQAIVHLGKEILSQLRNDELVTKKGPVFQTAIIAGVMGAKQTASLIPFCHSVGLDDCQIHITVKNEKVMIESEVVVNARTGVEMEALTAVTIAALTVYDMCKALSHEITIEETKLLEKTGGKSVFRAL